MAENGNQKKSELAKREEEILNFWLKERIFEKSEEKDAPNGEFVFYDGPPFATGLPHYGHILAGTIKDILPRYKTMQGYRVKRRWGWDCHGLPLENIIEKKLNLETKKDIEEMGIDVFNRVARESVLEFADDWRKIIPRMGRWVDMDDDYKTMDPQYTESVWWAFNELHKKKLVSEGFKSMHLCARCGTTLSNFEVAQGYKDIKDFSVTVKLELLDDPSNSSGQAKTYLLAWTTTPWTLPGNMAAAVHQDETYVSVELETGEIVILGKERIEEVLKDKPHKIVREFKGKELVGKSYKPPFDYYLSKDLEHKENAWKVWHADYVSQDDGTGLVHIAPAFGAEDLDLAREYNIPIVHHVGFDGTFVKEVTDFAGLHVKPKDEKEKGIDHTDTDVKIIKKLAHLGVLFAKEKIEHSYPHCWRCDEPLLNYAASSWFVTVPDIKDKLIAENQKVGWVPGDIRDGRFGKWLEGVRDWAISRSRYWGAPIPVWRKEQSGESVVIGSIEDLALHTKRSGNRYFMTRHGEAVFNTKGILNSDQGVENPLTENGKEAIKKSAENFDDTKIDLIVHSPLQRTRETAKNFQEALGLSEDVLVEDDRLREVTFGEFEGKTVDGYHSFFEYSRERLTKPPKGGETWNEVKQRITEVLYELEEKYSDKNIMIVSHNGPLKMLYAGAFGYQEDMCVTCIMEEDFAYAELREVPFIPLPHDEEYRLDLHRPYIDEVPLEKNGERLVRVPDVFDCWFESGSMPYGQFHHPFENREVFDPSKGIGYPADFIAEGLDQTRGWFYSMMVLGVALFGKSPYKNVVVNGLVLAEDGKKMSKKLQNYPDPMDVVDQYGADALRYYLLASPLVKADDLNFSEKGVAEVSRKNIGRLGNVLSFYELYKDEVEHDADDQSKHVLDVWILARLRALTKQMTDGFEKYELDKALRPVTDFIDDLSTWYVRRSRDRFKGEDETDKKVALETTRYVLQETAKLIAPSMPFFADHLYQSVCSDKESVHLEFWPQTIEYDQDILDQMQKVRDQITEALEAREKANLKVRQPLQSVTMPTASLNAELIEIIKDELNVKEVLEGDPISLNTALTPELIAEGNYRDLLRQTQALRKQAGLQPSDRIDLKIETDEKGEELVKQFLGDYKKVAGIENISFTSVDSEEIKIGELSFKLAL